MPGRCVVGGCSNTPGAGIRLHGFPRCAQRRRKWDKFIAITRKDWWIGKGSERGRTAICSAHFVTEDFDGHTEMRLGFRKHLTLKSTAIPSIRPKCATAVSSTPSSDRRAVRKLWLARMLEEESSSSEHTEKSGRQEQEHAVWDTCTKATQTRFQQPCVQSKDSLAHLCRAYPAAKMDLVKSEILTDTVQMQSACAGEVAGTPPDTGKPSQDRRQTSVESLLKQRICPTTESPKSCRLKCETDPVEDSGQSKSVLPSKRSTGDQQSVSTFLCPSNLHGFRRPEDSDEADTGTIKTETQEAGEIWSVNSADGGLASSTDEKASNLQGSGRPQYNDEANTVTIKTEPQDADEIWSVDSADGGLAASTDENPSNLHSSGRSPDSDEAHTVTIKTEPQDAGEIWSVDSAEGSLTISRDENASEIMSFADISVKTESPVFPVALFQNIHSSELVGSEVSTTRMDCKVEPQSITAKRDPDNFSNRPVAEQPQISPKGDQLKSETKVHNSDKLYQCMVCPTSFKAIIDLKGTDTLTGDDDECPECKQIYGSSRCLKIPHLKTPSDEKPFHCTQCSCAFPSKNRLEWHLRRHTGEKPYQCSVCQAKFAISKSLNNHMKSHSGENLYSCSDCPAAFTTTSLLQRHRRRIHADKKPHKCSECLRAFEAPSHLKKHAKIHSGKKPYQHSGRKPLKCSECPRTFTVPSQLKKHMKSHFGEKLYQCSECKRIFPNPGSLKQHGKTHLR